MLVCMLIAENILGLQQTYLFCASAHRIGMVSHRWTVATNVNLRASHQLLPGHIQLCWWQPSRAVLPMSCSSQGQRASLALHQCPQHRFVFYNNWWDWCSETPSHLYGAAKRHFWAISSWNLEVCQWYIDSQLLGKMNLWHCIVRSRLTPA